MILNEVNCLNVYMVVVKFLSAREIAKNIHIYRFFDGNKGQLLHVMHQSFDRGDIVCDLTSDGSSQCLPSL